MILLCWQWGVCEGLWSEIRKNIQPLPTSSIGEMGKRNDWMKGSWFEGYYESLAKRYGLEIGWSQLGEVKRQIWQRCHYIKNGTQWLTRRRVDVKVLRLTDHSDDDIINRAKAAFPLGMAPAIFNSIPNGLEHIRTQLLNKLKSEKWIICLNKAQI